MKTLLLMRHAKSSWADPALADFARPLNDRGRQAAPRMGRFLLQRALKPELVVCSPAERARQTAALVTEAAQVTAPTRYDGRIYEASAERLLEVVRELTEPHASALLVGHNPGLEQLIATLTNVHERMPTAALACVAFDLTAWRAVAPRAGRLAWLARPKELAAES
ncbi:MAG TPA: histidine phosphatase family protein [Pyrinomonadaceae bacterium]|jgi:phosphohistidine phosphatase